MRCSTPAGNLIGQVTSIGGTLTLTPTATFELIAQQTDKTVTQVQQEFATFQQILSTYDIGKQLVPSTPPPSDGKRGDANPQQPTKFAGSSVQPSDSTHTTFNGQVGGNTTGTGSGSGTTVLFTTQPSNPTGGTPTTPTTPDTIQTVFVPTTPAAPFVVTPSPITQVSSGSDDHFGPVMSADGQFVAYDPGGAIFLYDRSTNTTTTITPAGTGLTYSNPSISADGHYIVYAGSSGNGQSEIFLYDNNPADAGYQHTTQLHSGGVASISGDGSTIVSEDDNGIAVYNQQGQTIATITPVAIGGGSEGAWRPSISTDGHLIAFWSTTTNTPGGAGELYTYNLSTGQFTAIADTATGAGTSPASISADGHYIVFQSDASDLVGAAHQSEIFLYDTTTHGVVFSTANAAGASYNPVISPDGHFIIFASDAQLTPEDTNSVADTYIVNVTDPSNPVYTLVSALDGTAGNAASNLGATISANGLYYAFGSDASNFATGATGGTGNIFFVDPSSGHSAIILENANSPAELSASGVIQVTGSVAGEQLAVSQDPSTIGVLTAVFDTNGNIDWTYQAPQTAFASLQPGQSSAQNFVITLSTDSGSTTTIPVTVSVYDANQPVVTVANTAPVATPVTLPQGQEDQPFTITSAELLAGATDINGLALSVTAVSIASGGGALVDNHDGTFAYTPAAHYSGAVSFNYTVSDGTLTASSTASLTLAATDVAPVITSSASASVVEGTPVTTPVFTVTATDAASLPIIYSLSGTNAAAFNIDPVTGTVTLKAVADYQTQPSYSFNVVASDGILSTIQAVTVAVTDVAPTITSSNTASVVEGTPTTAPVFTAMATDVVGSPVTYSLSGTNAAQFNIDPVTGVVTLRVVADYQTQPSYSFNFVASDGTLSTTQAVTVAVTDVAPTITSSASASVVEGAPTIAPVFTATAIDVVGSAVTYSLSGTNASQFNIDPVTGVVTLKMVADYQTQPSYSFNVVASDGTLSTTQAVTVAVTDVAPTITSNNAASVVEGTPTTAPVFTAMATDVVGSPVTYSLSGTNAAQFNIDPVTGVVTLKAVADYRTQPSYSFNVVASDGTLSSTQAVTVNVTDVAPVITSSASASVVEGTPTTAPVFTAMATDVVGSPVTYSLSGTNAAQFNIDPVTGVVTLKAVADYQTQPSYSFNVVASDGTLSTTQAVTVAVTDVAPTVTSGASVSVVEGTPTTTPVFTATATDVVSSPLTYSLSGPNASQFNIDPATGVVTLKAVADYQTQPSYSFNVVASDGTLSTTQAVIVAVTDVAPTITSGAAATVVEGTPITTPVYTATATDVVGAPITYSLTGTDAAKFNIDATSGVVTLKAVADYQTQPSYSFVVDASDGSLVATQAVTVAVTDVAPTITSGASASVIEGTPISTPVYTATATDVVNSPLTYSLAGTDAAAFSINSSTGVVTINNVPDFETKPSYSFNVVASDGTLSSNHAVTLAVTDLPPVIYSAATANVNEGVAVGTTVYTAIAADPGGGSVIYSLTGADAAAFTINSSTGVVTVNNVPDFETKSSYSFNVKAGDPSGAFNTEAVTVSVNDLPPAISSVTTANVNEGVPAGTTVYTAIAADPGGGTVIYSLTGADAAAFTINAATGVVTINNTPDFETKSSYSFDVKASDPSGGVQHRKR